MKTVYFDHAATTPLDSRVLEAMLPFFNNEFGNASSSHHKGRNALMAVEESREKIAHYLDCKPSEIIFTSGGTESNNTVIQGVAETGFRNEMISSQAEHHAVLHAIEHTSVFDYQTHLLKPDSNGVCSPETLENCISDQTALVSLMHFNNEIGSINPIKELAEIAHAHGSLFHSDLVQSAGKIPLSMRDLNLDFASFSAHKFYGPKGVGILFARSGIHWKPFMIGGAQERDRRAGTLNVPGIVGIGKAFELAHLEMEARNKHISNLKNKLVDEIKSRFSPFVEMNHPENSAHHIVNCSFILSNQHSIEGETLLMNLDMQGICCSNGSACAAGAVIPSHVLQAIGLSNERAKSSLRISLGKDNTEEELHYFIEKLADILKRMSKGEIQ